MPGLPVSRSVDRAGRRAEAGGVFWCQGRRGLGRGPRAPQARRRRRDSLGEVIPGSTAEAAGFKAGDVLLALDGTKIAGAGEFVRTIGGRKGGCRGDDRVSPRRCSRKEKVTLKGRPFEKSDAYEVVYGSVPSRAGRLRTILTRPKGEGKHPALFLIQGIGLFSIDNPVGPLSSYKIIVDDFTRHGFVTLRVDKPGCGDSEGGPARDVDFDTELDGYRQALKMLKARGDVDADRVFIFGHSMGGVMAPLLAAEIPVRGIIVYGTITRTWTEYWLENIRRQMELADTDPSAIDRDLRTEAALATYLYAEKMSPKEIVERLSAPSRATRADDHRGPLLRRSQLDVLSASSPTRTWARPGSRSAGMPWRSGARPTSFPTRTTTRLIARIVNRDHPGHGTFLAMDGIDHGFNRAASRRESFERGQSRQPAEFNPAILEVCRAWVEKTAAQPADPAKPAS